MRSKAYVARSQADACLLYHVESDELYLLRHDGFLILQLCDGRNTVRDIVAIAEPLFAAARELLAERVLAFLRQLLERGILDASPA